MIYLLDTDTFILLLRGTAITRAKTQRQEVVKRSAGKILVACKKRKSDGHLLGLSAITLAELEFGLQHGGNQEGQQSALRKCSHLSENFLSTASIASITTGSSGPAWNPKDSASARSIRSSPPTPSPSARCW
jgi:hypothetical protein